MKRIYNRRPLVLFSICYAVGIYAGRYVGINVLVLWTAAFLFIFLTAAAFYKNRLSWTMIFISGILLGICMFNTVLFNPDSSVGSLYDKNVTMTGMVSDIPEIKNNHITYVISNIHFDKKDTKEKYKEKAIVYVYPDYGKKISSSVYKYGTFIRITGKMNKIQGLRNPGGFDYRKYLTIKDIGFSVTTNLKHIIFIKSQISLKGIILGLRTYLDRHLDLLTEQKNGILNGIVLGTKSEIPNNIINDFSITGVAHILAVSGSNVGYIAVFFIFIFNAAGMDKKKIFYVLTCIIVFFAVMTGASASVLRASIMALISLYGKYSGRNTDLFTTMAASFLMILIFSPLQLFDTGFQLSFSAVFGILLFYKVFLNKLHILPDFIRKSISLTLSAEIGIIPLSIAYFNRLSLISIIANLIVLPLSGIITILGIAALLITIAMPSFIFIFKWILSGSLYFMTYVIELFATIPYSSVRLSSPGRFLIFIYFLLIFFLSPYTIISLKIKKKFLIFICTAVLSVCIISNVFICRKLQIVFIDVGQGDSCIYITPEGKTVLIDGGGSNNSDNGGFDTGRNILVPFLLNKGITKIDTVVLSHGHADHAEGLKAVIGEFPVKHFVESPIHGKVDAVYNDLIKIVESKRIPIYNMSAGDYFREDDLTFNVIYPDKNKNTGIDNTNENNNSLIMCAQYKGFTALMTGDAEKGVEKYLIKNKMISNVDLLKVAHHGSITSSTDEWIRALNPRIAIISVGKNNFGHPNPDVVNRFKSNGTAVYRTDQSGAITVTYYNGKIKVYPFISN